MESRPILNMQRTPLQKWMNILSLLIIGATTIYLILNFATLPKEIPVHFNFRGDIDNWAPKGSIFILWGIGILIYILNTRTQLIPHKFNYIVEITEVNAEKQYQLGVRMMTILNLELMMIIAYLHWAIIENVQLNTYIMIIFLIAMFSTFTVYLVISRKHR